MYLAVKEVFPTDNYRLILVFEDGQKRLLDMTPMLDFGIFRELRDEQLFKSVRVNFDTIEWANEADLDPEMLYTRSVALS